MWTRPLDPARDARETRDAIADVDSVDMTTLRVRSTRARGL
jgi:hypothetical protein